MATYLNNAKYKLLNLRRLGTGNLRITHFCVGVAPQYEVSPTQTNLVNRINIGSDNKKAIESATQVSNQKVTYQCRLEEEECVGQNITELGLIDGDGDLVCIKTFPEKAKTSEREMVFYIDDTWEEVDE